MNEKAQKRLLALHFSPRRDSNSSRLLEVALAGAPEVGIEVIHLRPIELNIEPCIACETCYSGAPCPIEDDMARVYDLLRSVDAVAIATPSYFYGIPSRAKALIDRCQPFWARKYIIAETLPLRPAAVIEVAGSGGARVFDGINLTMKYFLDSIFVEMPEPLCFRHIDCEPKDLPEAALEAASEYGKRFLSSLIEKEK